ncbi:MAG: HYR domain-containing protein, partial [bacterium]
MKHHSARRCISVLAAMLLVLAMARVASAKSLYVIADHVAPAADAWNIGPNGNVTNQASYGLIYALEPVGMAVDADSRTLFITAEYQYGFEMVDAVTMKSLGWVEAPAQIDLAGIDVDDEHNLIYTVRRSRPEIYVYNWDPNFIDATDPNNVIVNPGAVTLRAGYPRSLPNCEGPFGVALDEETGILYIADSKAGKVRGYSVNTWEEVMTYEPTGFVPGGIAVDRRRQFLYATAPDLNPPQGNCLPCTRVFDPDGYTLISKYDLKKGEETVVMDLGHGGMGIAVEEITGYVYVTGGCNGDNISVWDPLTDPSTFTFVQETEDIGNPAGIVVGNISYNPLNLTKQYDGCVDAGENIIYTICYDNLKNGFDVNNVKLKDSLPAEMSFISASNGGNYNSETHTVTWDIGTLPSESPEQCVYLEVQVSSTISKNTFVNYATISFEGIDETGQSHETLTTVENERSICCEASGCPDDIVTYANPGQCGAEVFWEVPTFDACGDNLEVTSNHDPGDFFPAECEATARGTEVTYIAKDDGIIIGKCTFTVTVLDMEAPVVSGCPPTDITMNAVPGQCGANVFWTPPTFTDNCEVTWTATHEPGAFFPVGNTTVTYTATDGCGHETICSFTVTVQDDIPPEARCRNITVQLDDSGNVSISTADVDDGSTDNCQIADLSVDPSAFTCDNIGDNSATLTVTDTSGNIDTCTAVVTVQDITAPSVSNCPDDILVYNTPGQCGAEVNWEPPVFEDICTVEVSSTHNPGDFFPAECEAAAQGTVVTYTATDPSGNTATCSFKVVVLDTEAPVMSGCPADITVDAPLGQCEAAVSWTPPTFTDNCGPVTVTSNHNPGDIFPAGSTLVTYTASDACGNASAACSFTVTVTGGEPLAVENCPEDITAHNEPGQCGAAVTWTPPTFSGSCNGPITVSVSAVYPDGSTRDNVQPGDFFPAGCEAAAQGTVVTYTATETLTGNTVTCSFTVVVLDTEAPVVNGCPPIDITTEVVPGQCETRVTWTPPAFTDNCSSQVT